MSPTIEVLDLRSCSGRSGSGSVLAGPHNTAAGEEAPEPWLPYSHHRRLRRQVEAVYGEDSTSEDPFARPDLIRGGVAAPLLPITPLLYSAPPYSSPHQGALVPSSSNLSHFPPSLIFALL